MSQTLKELYDQLTEAINDIDTKLDSLDDSSAVSSRKIINDLVEVNRPTWENVTASLVSQLETVPVEVQVGVFYGLVRELDKKLGKVAKEHVASLAESAPKATPLITPEEAGPLSETRKELFAKIKNLVEMAKTFGDSDADEMEIPARRNVSSGPRGPRALSLFTWSIGDKTYDKLKDVVDQYAQYEKVSELTKAMRDAEIDTRNPGARIEFVLPDGETLVGVNSAYSPEDDAELDNDEDDTSDED